MPSDSNGIYSLPAGYLAKTGETIEASQHNPPLEDLASAMSSRLMRSGAAPMNGPLKLIDGTASVPAMAFATAPNTGVLKTSSGLGFSIGGALVAELKPTGLEILGLAQFVTEALIVDKAVTPRKMYRPSGPSKILGTNSNPALAITGAANNGTGLIRLSVADSSTFETGQKKTVSDVLGTIEANGTWTITVVDATHIDLQGSAFANAWTSGGSIGGAVDELTLGAGLELAGTVLSAPGMPMQSSFKNLVVKVLTNTTVRITADFVTMADGTGKFRTRPVNSTVDLGTSGGIDALEGALTIEQANWYRLWAIAKADGTTKVLANLSDTAVTLPTGYTFAARIGTVRTAPATAQLMGTWQFGRNAQYILGLAQTTAALLLMDSGTKGSLTTPTWIPVAIGNFVPPTASRIRGSIRNFNGGAMAAPNAAYAGMNVSTDGPPVSNSSTVSWGIPFDFLIEAASIQWASDNGNGQIRAVGWEDNI